MKWVASRLAAEAGAARRAPRRRARTRGSPPRALAARRCAAGRSAARAAAAPRRAARASSRAAARPSRGGDRLALPDGVVGVLDRQLRQRRRRSPARAAGRARRPPRRAAPSTSRRSRCGGWSRAPGGRRRRAPAGRRGARAAAARSNGRCVRRRREAARPRAPRAAAGRAARSTTGSGTGAGGRIRCRGPAAGLGVDGAQHLVPRGDRAERRGERRRRERPAERQRQRHVVGRAGLPAVEEPEAALGEGEGQGAVAAGAPERRGGRLGQAAGGALRREELLQVPLEAGLPLGGDLRLRLFQLARAHRVRFRSGPEMRRPERSPGLAFPVPRIGLLRSLRQDCGKPSSDRAPHGAKSLIAAENRSAPWPRKGGHRPLGRGDFDALEFFTGLRLVLDLTVCLNGFRR